MGYTSLLLKTLQTTKYVNGDDGDLQVGAARSFTVLDTGQYSGTTTISLAGATENHTNNCVQDNVTGLMWSKSYGDAVGVDYGKGRTYYFPWETDGNGIGIFPYVAAANAALLAGYGNDPNPLLNWRIPDVNELYSIINHETHTWISDISIPGACWSSTSRDDSAKLLVSYQVVGEPKISGCCVLLVRGAPTAPPAGVNTLRSLLGAGY
jgi:hypothetical protein